jgi:hypothetical protein
MTAGGFRLATSVGGTLTGRGGEYLIIDDPLKPEDALSESKRRLDVAEFCAIAAKIGLDPIKLLRGAKG